MTSTYLHVNCVVGVACAEAFANKNIANRRADGAGVVNEDLPIETPACWQEQPQ